MALSTLFLLSLQGWDAIPISQFRRLVDSPTIEKITDFDKEFNLSSLKVCTRWRFVVHFKAAQLKCRNVK
jgi:hypothetical protein